LSKRRSSTCSWPLISTICGSLLCSLLGGFGVLLPFSIFGAAALTCSSLGLALLDRRSRRVRAGEVDGGGFDSITALYDNLVMFLYQGRLSRGKGLDLLERTASFMSQCDRLKSCIHKAGQVPAGANSGRFDNTAGAVGTVMEEVITSVREMSGVLRDVDHNAKELITSTEETAYSMTRLDSFLQDMANSGRELEASTDTANRVALEGTKVVEEMGRENEAIISTVNEAASAVEDLGRWSQEVGKIVEVIRDIANETNLLALNASIIAAQSGEHGKAFGVVAEEIRGLAERTSSSTKEISDLVKAVQKNVANVVNGMKKSLQSVERGELLTRNAGTVLEKVFESFESSRNLAKQIASSTFEHKIDSSQVVRSLQKVTDIARRLQSRDYNGWTGAGETLGIARTLSTLYEHGNVLKPGIQPGGFIEGEHEGVGLALPEASAKDDPHDLLKECDLAIGRCMDSLEETGHTLDSWLSALEDLSRSAAAGFEVIAGKSGVRDLRSCWEIAHCDDKLREKCAAYGNGDRSLFFGPEAACMPRRAGGGAKLPAHSGASPSGSKHTVHTAHKVGS